MDDIAKLEQQFCPPIDPALFSAIISDFDLSNPEHVDQARETLESIKVAALEEENTPFDPSGTSAQHVFPEEADVSQHGISNSESWPQDSETTETTSLSAGLQSLHLEADFEENEAMLAQHVEEMEKLDLLTKKSLLVEMFPSVGAYTVEHTLRKCSGKWDRAMDELLNEALLSGKESIEGEEKVYAKGIEAFLSETNSTPRGRRKNNKKRTGGLNVLDESTRSSSAPAPANKWETGRRDIDFIVTRTKVSVQTVSSIYHRNGANLAATLVALADSRSSDASDDKITSDDTVLQVHAYELGREFPSIPASILTGLIRLTHPSTSAAHEFAKTIAQSATKGGLQVIPNYTAPLLTSTSEHAGSDEGLTSGPSSHKTSPYSSGRSTPNPTALASYYSHLHRRALSQARDAAQTSRSQGNKRYMSAAAAYYSQQSREWARASAAASSSAADAHVSLNSAGKRDEVDLHGVTVKDGVRIALQATAAWWKRTGGTRIKGLDGRVVSEDGSRTPSEFRVVTGLGRHSESGRGKLTPAVERALVNDGWDAVAMEGVVTVRGKKRR